MSSGEPAQTKNVAVDARPTYWKLRTRGHPEFSLGRVFCRSRAARALFADYGRTTFWRTDAEREALDRHNAGEFAPGFFSNMKPWETLRTAYIDDTELGRITAAFHKWKKARQKPPRLWERLFGAGYAWSSLTKAV